MLQSILARFFGSSNERKIKEYQKRVGLINRLEPEFAAFSDDELIAQTAILKQEHNDGKSLDELLPRAFAVVREASKRVLGMRHFDVQLMGGMALHDCSIAEMKTGEGKTLVSTLPCYLNALTGKSVHLVTVNDYLATRDSEWMGKLYRFLGLTVGCITRDLTDEERKIAYNSDITYATNNELGFDYLRDNMKYSLEEMVHRPFNFAVIDEVDSILIDEARTPLIISGPTEDNSNLYYEADKLIYFLIQEDYEVDEKDRIVSLTEVGVIKMEQALRKKGLIGENAGLYDLESISLVHYVNQALRAHKLFKNDVDYVVNDGKVVIIDEFTGRMMPGRRFSEGLHQALEAKEKVVVQNENQTLASITFQNYFRLYPKISGMTGTAMTEAAEFSDIYNLSVIAIPTNVNVARIDEDDEIYKDTDNKFIAIVKEIETAHEKGQPILVGTASIDRSEYLSDLLKKKKIQHKVLNAKFHAEEAEIIAQAGKKGAVTIATNMAGRGTDIKLGGNIDEELSGLEQNERERLLAEFTAKKDEVVALGGLYIIGTERHESRRIDNQLRGRSGRQGDKGRSKFFLSLGDDLMRIFGSDRLSSVLGKLGVADDEAIQHPWISKSLEKAQAKVEARNYEMRKNLLKYDDVMNEQRKIIFEQRLELITAQDISPEISAMIIEINQQLIATHITPSSYYDKWDLQSLDKAIFEIYGLRANLVQSITEEMQNSDVSLVLKKLVETHFLAKETAIGTETMRDLEKRILLFTLDFLWKDHLHSLDSLRRSIDLRAYGQKDPLIEYKREAFILFDHLFDALKVDVIKKLSHLEVVENIPAAPVVKGFETRLDPALEEIVAKSIEPKVSRNSPCSCGSGKKYKHCHGIL